MMQIEFRKDFILLLVKKIHPPTIHTDADFLRDVRTRFVVPNPCCVTFSLEYGQI